MGASRRNKMSLKPYVRLRSSRPTLHRATLALPHKGADGEGFFSPFFGPAIDGARTRPGHPLGIGEDDLLSLHRDTLQCFPPLVTGADFQITNFPRYVFGDRERDVTVVTPRSILRDAIEQEFGDLAGVIPAAHPIKRPPFFCRQHQGIHG